MVEIEDLALWAAILVSCMYVPRGRASWFIAVGGERRENCLPVTRSLRSRRSYGKIGDCDKSNSISQKKQRYIYSLHFLQLTSACPSISCVSCFTCACVRSHGIVTDRIGVTAVRVGGALVDICMRKWNRTRLKSHGDYIYLIVYIWSPVYVFFFYLRNKVGLTVSNVSFTLHRNCTFFHTNQIFLRATFFIFTRIGIGLHTKLVNPLTETASF